MQTQDEWHLAHFPHLPSSAPSRAAVWFVQVEDPSVLLTTARWESVAAHWDWYVNCQRPVWSSGREKDCCVLCVCVLASLSTLCSQHMHGYNTRRFG
jgi:hypothetical protein